MRHLTQPSETRPLRLGVALLGILLLASAALAGDTALTHMAALGVICGAASAPHCAACIAATTLGLTGALALVWANWR